MIRYNDKHSRSRVVVSWCPASPLWSSASLQARAPVSSARLAAIVDRGRRAPPRHPPLAIPLTSGALTSLNLASNYLMAEGAKQVAEAIKGHVSALRFDWYHFELDLTSGSTAVVYGYSYYNTTKGALETITFGDKQAVTMKADMTEADFSGKQLGAYSGAIIVAAFLPKCQ